MKRLVALLVCGLFSTGVVAGEWGVYSFSSESRSLFAVSTQAPMTVGKYLRTWEATVNSEPKDPYDLRISLLEISCSEKRYRQVQASYYLRGKSIDRDDDGPWQYAIPETVGEALVDAVCQKHPLFPYLISEHGFYELVVKGKKLLREVRQEWR